MLTEPQELLELADGETTSFRVEKWEFDKCVIHTPDAPQGKVIDCLRVHVPSADKQHFPFYWDITSKRLTAQLLPILQQPGFENKTYTVVASGVKPRKWFMLEVR